MSIWTVLRLISKVPSELRSLIFTFVAAVASGDIDGVNRASEETARRLAFDAAQKKRYG